MVLSIIIPAYNEEKTLEKLVLSVLKVKFGKFRKEIIIVDDGSKDRTAAIAQKLARKYKEIKFLKNPQNMGKSQTVRNGIVASTGDVVVIQDADLEYDPDDLKPMLKEIEAGADVVYGNRFGKKNEVIYFENYFGNKVLSFFSNLFTYPRFRVWIPDMEVCYKMIDGKIARKVGGAIVSRSMIGLEPEITARLARYKVRGKHLKLVVLPVSYKPRKISEGKHIRALRDGSKALWEIIRFNVLERM